MQGRGRQFDEGSAATRQLRLSTALGLLVLTAFAFALARFLKLDGLAREYGRGFLKSPAYSLLNLVLYGLLAWKSAFYFRQPILQASPSWSLNGAFFGTLYGASLFGMTVWYGVAFLESPLLFAAGMLACGLTGPVLIAFPTVLFRAFVESFRFDMRMPWRAARAGALFGAVAGYASVFPIALFSVPYFLAYGLVPALFGAVCGARGAFLQAISQGDRGSLPAAALGGSEIRSTTRPIGTAFDVRFRKSTCRNDLTNSERPHDTIHYGKIVPSRRARGGRIARGMHIRAPTGTSSGCRRNGLHHLFTWVVQRDKASHL